MVTQTSTGPASSNEPAGRRPAPGDLAVVQAFVNTNDLEGEDERLGDPAALGSWLVDARLCPPGTRPTRAEFALAVDVREGLRALGRANNGEPLASGELRGLNDAVRRIPLVARFERDAWHLDPSSQGVQEALGWILSVVVETMSDGSWFCMKACRRDRCRCLFYDYSKNHSGVWCAMEICGNKEKALAYRRRSRARSAGKGE